MNKLTKHISDSFPHALLMSMLTVALLLLSYFLIEPVVGRSQADTETFTVNQRITGEHALFVATSSLGMVGSIGGVTGGQATGTVEFSVTSNNVSGYDVNLGFEDTGNKLAVMEGNTSGSYAIRNYSWGASTPTYDLQSSTSAQFAYSVRSVDIDDAPAAFKDNGSNTCGGAGSLQTTDKCWKTPTSTVDTLIVASSDAAPVAASSTIKFSVVVPSNADPIVPADTYTATATLTLTINP